MFDDENQDENNELKKLEYMEVIGIQQIQVKQFGRERGLNPNVSEPQQKEIKKLAAKITMKSQDQSKNLDDDTDSGFDLLAQPRVILYEGKVTKKSQTSMVQHQSKRYLYLLNDVLLITSSSQSSKSSSLSLSFASDKIIVHNVCFLDNVALSNLSWSNADNSSCSFELLTSERSFEFTAESESDKRIWLEEIEAAIFAIKLANPKVLNIGWMHEIILGTLFSSAYFGDVDLLKVFIENQRVVLDSHDACGMSAMHWAAFRGHVEAVQLLVTAGAKVDNLNNGLNSPLMLAASQGHHTVVLNLIGHEADIHIRNLKDRDALFMAVLYGGQSLGLYSILRTMIDHGVDINMPDSAGSTALHECSSRNLPRSVMLLVDAGANINLMHSRNGLTPLQLACTTTTPDVETVRALLEKGSYPNWKDAGKRSSFDMILSTHQLRFNSQKAQEMSTNSEQGLKQTVDEVSSFVQEALPVLMEVVRKGARYTDESLAQLRPSFREAIDSARSYWLTLTQDEYFEDFAKSKVPSELQASNWVSDSESKFCLLCLQNFSYSFRRHHCRTCGVLCCDLCSSKRLKIKIDDSEHSKNDTPPKSKSFAMRKSPADIESKPERVCDGCFNRLSADSFTRHQDIVRAKKEQDRQEEKERQERELKASAVAANTSGRNSPMNTSSMLFSGSMWSSNSSRPDTTNKSPPKSLAAKQTDRTKTVLNEAAVALAERGVKLQQTLDNSEQMRDAASQYHVMAKQLLQQQQRKHGMF